MKIIRLRLILILWFMASMSFANTHIHHDTGEHTHCIKCIALDLASGSDAPVTEPIRLNLPRFGEIFQPDSVDVDKRPYTATDARAPPSPSVTL
ncbi:MAG: hypothetical protein PHW64_00875 [Sulfuricurvum sp.]|nr:hypothetical protein [Sulfuricurvum sp.]